MADRLRAKEKTDMQKLIRLVLDTPLSSKEPLVEVDGERSLEEYKKAPVDIKTRIVLQMAADAMKGDSKARQDIFKYGGFEPIKEQHLMVETPVIIDDMGADPATPVEGAAVEGAVEGYVVDEVYDDPEESGE